MTHLAPVALPIPILKPGKMIPMPGRGSLPLRALPVGLAPRAWLPRRFNSVRPALCDEHGVPGSVPRLFSVTGAMCGIIYICRWHVTI